MAPTITYTGSASRSVPPEEKKKIIKKPIALPWAYRLQDEDALPNHRNVWIGLNEEPSPASRNDQTFSKVSINLYLDKACTTSPGSPYLISIYPAGYALIEGGVNPNFGLPLLDRTVLANSLTCSSPVFGLPAMSGKPKQNIYAYQRNRDVDGLILRLDRVCDNMILHAVDMFGKQRDAGNIFKFRPSMKWETVARVSGQLGLMLTTNGSIITAIH